MDWFSSVWNQGGKGLAPHLCAPRPPLAPPMSWTRARWSQPVAPARCRFVCQHSQRFRHQSRPGPSGRWRLWCPGCYPMGALATGDHYSHRGSTGVVRLLYHCATTTTIFGPYCNFAGVGRPQLPPSQSLSLRPQPSQIHFTLQGDEKYHKQVEKISLRRGASNVVENFQIKVDSKRGTRI